MFDLHRHDEYSTYDGFGKAEELAILCEEYGYNSLCTTNHGNTNGLIKTYLACKKHDLKAILGIEGYFLPKYKEQTRGYHLILIAKNLVGYGNLNRIQFEGEKQKYYNPIWTFDLLEKYHDGLICTSACVAGYLANCIKSDNLDLAKKYLKKMVDIFGDDFYIEIQPYKISEKGLQEKVNRVSIQLAQELKIKCILTSDSHRGKKEDIDTYIKMHEIAGNDISHIEETYSERYMPAPGEIQERFIKMHIKDFGNSTKSLVRVMCENLDEIENKCEKDYLDELPLKLPKVDNINAQNSKSEIKLLIQKGLREKGKWIKEYIERAKEELDVIKYHGFEDYFLIVADYVNWAKKQGISVGPGRGSVCNSIVAYALGITEVDSILFNLDFRRFLRKDKKALPDIDLDFETARRQEVIDYLVNKYKGHAARICSYGLYKIDNLINDLAKKCGLETDKTVDESLASYNKKEIKEIKSFVKLFIDEDGSINSESMLDSPQAKVYNDMYDNIIIHFTKLFDKVKYIGTHAAGVAITGGNILDYVSIKIDKDGNYYTSYDLEDVESINVIKFDILGLKTMSSIKELRETTGVTCDYENIVKDEKIMEYFKEGLTDGVFQFEKDTARKILAKINCDCFEDVIAASSMNRPGPLKLGMPEQYAENKLNISEAMKSFYYQYTKDSYGTIIYQEQLQQICVYIGGLTWSDADRMLKLMKHGEENARKLLLKDKEENGSNNLQDMFIKGAIEHGLAQYEAEELFNNMLVYSFVKGHGTGYSLISVEEMYYKVYYPTEYWYTKLKYAGCDADFYKFCEKAVIDGAVVFLPHVNYSSAKTRLRKIDGENVLQQGLADIKGVGEKAADFILNERKTNGIFTSFDNFYDRCKSRVVTSRVIETLKTQSSALVFNKKTYLNMVTKYNSALYSRGLK